HGIAARLIDARQRDPDRPLAELVADASAQILGAPLRYSEAALATILSARHFVEVRKTLGGPAPEETARAIAASRAQLEADRTWLTRTSGALSAAERRLAERSARL